MRLQLQGRRFRFSLRQPLRTAAGVLDAREGWLLRIEASDGALGWGEVAPLDSAERPLCEAGLEQLVGEWLPRSHLEERLPMLSPALGFGVGAALAELDGLVGNAARQGWLAAPRSAELLPAGDRMLHQLEQLLEQRGRQRQLTVKWKVAADPDPQEWSLLEALLERLPSTASLRLDANGGWSRATARRWMERLVGDPRFAWLEQPLAPNDQEGLDELAGLGPVALDESLDQDPSLRDHWCGWQVRRPLLEGDPRPLLRQLQECVPYRMLSTAFETGIGRRWLHHLAALQQQGPTPVAPGLAPGWCPSGPLFSEDPNAVWEAALP